jgi:DDE superfamily endonuclease/Homeodomain-like domain
MVMTSPDVIVLSAAQRQGLARIVRAGKSAQRLALRARIVLAAAAGCGNAAIGVRLGVCVDTVRKWRHRWAVSPGVASLTDAKRCGRPAGFTPVQVAHVKALACQPPPAVVGLSRWSCPELARQAMTSGVCASLSPSTVRRWLAQDALKPWQYRSWISIRDPHFQAKAARVLDLYAGRWKGRRLGPNDIVICADEKTSIQARCRCHPTLPPGRARAMRVEHEYERGGAVAYLAAWDVHRGQVIGRCEQTTGIEPFARLVEQVMTTEPYASADRVFWIVDNGSSHRGQAAIDRMRQAWPTAQLIHTPVHASWLNQCEIYFSVIQRKVVSPNDFADTEQIRDRLAAFEARYNPIATPYDWKFTRRDLHDLLRRIEQHDHDRGDQPRAA